MSRLPIRRRDFATAQFAGWLARNGAEIGVPTNPYEVIRYRAFWQGSPRAVTHIVYAKENGLLTFMGGAREHYEAFLSGRDLPAGPEINPFVVPKRQRHAALAAAEGRQTKGEKRREKLLARDGEDCWFCGLVMGDDCTIEHLVPKSRKGSDSLDNFVLAHSACNARAADMPLVQKIALRAEMRAAQGIDARSGATGTGAIGAADESPVAAGDAPTLHPQPSEEERR